MKPIINLLIVAGQSNVVGYRSDVSGFSALPDDSEILYNYGYGENPHYPGDSVGQTDRTDFGPIVVNDGGGNGFVDGGYTIPAGESWFGFGPELISGQRLKSTGKPLAVIKYAKGNTSLLTDWHPSTGTHSQALIDRIQAIKTSLEVDYTVRLAGIVWWQGENDAGSTTNATQYKNLLVSLIERIKSVMMTRVCPVVICKTVNSASKVELLQKSQKAAAKMINSARIYDPSELPLFTDNLHFYQDAHITSGSEIADIFEEQSKVWS